MKAIFALCFIALLAGSLAHKSKKASHHQHESKLIGSIMGLAQLAQTPDELSDVYTILEEVKGEIADILARVQNDYETDAANWAAAAEQYSDEIDALEASISADENELSGLQDNAATFQAQIDEDVSDIADTQSQLDNENARRAAAHDAFTAKYQQFQDAIDGANDALVLLQEIDSQDLSGSFLEINSKKIKTHFHNIHKSLKNIPMINAILPISKLLVEVTQDGINHDLIVEIENLINQLISTLGAESDAAVDADNQDEVDTQLKVGNYTDTINTLSANAESNQESLNDVNGQISTLTDALNAANTNLGDEKDAYASGQSDWSTKSNNYEALLNRLAADIEAITAAEQFIDSSEQHIDSSDEV